MPFAFVSNHEPHSLAWLEAGVVPLTFAGLADRAEILRLRFMEAQLPDGAVIAVGSIAPLDLVTAFLAASTSWAFAAVDPRLTAGEREEYWTGLLPHALLDERLQLHPCANGRTVDAALCLVTSATTGRAKIVPQTLAQLESAARNTREALQLTPSDRFLCLTPLHHLQALGSLFAQWSAGGSVAYAGPFDAVMFPRWLDEFRPTWFTASAVVLEAILAIPGPLPHCLRFIRTIGAPVPAATMVALERRFQVPVLEGYGLTEVGLVASNPLPPRMRKAGFVGPSAGPEIRIAPNDEILVRSPSLFQGYLNAEEQPIDPEGWFHTGDLGSLDSEGYLRIFGRLKEVTNRGGEKILLAEIDRALATHPYVRDVAAFSVPHPTLGEDLACALVLQRGALVSAQDLRTHCRQSLAAGKIPRHFVFLDGIPRGATGKVQRHLLRLSEAPRSDLVGVPIPLRARWRDAICREPISAHDDFFLCGGDSLSAAAFLTAISAEYSISMERLVPFLERPTLAYLVDIIETSAACPSTAHQLTFFPDAPGPHLFLIGATSSGFLSLRALALELGPLRPVTILRTAGEPSDRAPGHIAVAAHNSLDVIRELQPRGPYLLAGHCYGGIIAFEVARLLIEEKPGALESVHRLILLDAPCPGPYRLHARWRLLEGLVPLPKRPGSILDSPLPAAIDVLQVCATLPRVRTLVLEDPRLSWQRFTSRRMHLHFIDATHETLLQAPAVQHLARLLDGVLAE